MKYLIVSFLLTIFFVVATYCMECTSGPGYRFPKTCPGWLDDSEKNYCCEIDGSFQCCYEEEFSSQLDVINDDAESFPVLRYKRDYEDAAVVAAGLGTAAIIGIILASCSPILLICCCCWCCACCPCYHWCHSNSNSTNVTIVQPGAPAAAPSTNVHNFSFGGAPQSAMPSLVQPAAVPPPMEYQQPPPQYTK